MHLPHFKNLYGRSKRVDSKEMYLQRHCGLLCGQFVPEAIHNPVAIELLVSGLLNRHILCTSVFTS